MRTSLILLLFIAFVTLDARRDSSSRHFELQERKDQAKEDAWLQKWQNAQDSFFADYIDCLGPALASAGIFTEEEISQLSSRALDMVAKALYLDGYLNFDSLSEERVDLFLHVHTVYICNTRGRLRSWYERDKPPFSIYSSYPPSALPIPFEEKVSIQIDVEYDDMGFPRSLKVQSQASRDLLHHLVTWLLLSFYEEGSFEYVFDELSFPRYRIEVLEEVSNQPTLARPISETIHPPPLARRGIGGHLVAEIAVSSTGVPSAVEVVDSSLSSFDEAVSQALLKSRWQPAIRDGQPVDCRIRMTLSLPWRRR